MRMPRFNIRQIMLVTLVVALEMGLFASFNRPSGFEPTARDRINAVASWMVFNFFFVLVPSALVCFWRSFARYWNLWPYHDRPRHNDPYRGIPRHRLRR